MGIVTKIEWADMTFNGWIGCEKVSKACAHCYAETSTRARVLRSQGRETWGKGAQRERTSEANWALPLRWNKQAAAGFFRRCTECGGREMRKWDSSLPPGGLSRCSTPGCLALSESESEVVRPRVFCASLSDVFDPAVPKEWRHDLLRVIDSCQELDWLILTKRPQLVRELLEEVSNGNVSDFRHMPNVWLGTTVEDQQCANERIAALLNIPASVRFLSCEPLLGAVDLTRTQDPSAFSTTFNALSSSLGMSLNGSRIDWVICGGESGDGARPMDPVWVRGLRDQCADNGTPFLFKQWGSFAPFIVTAGGCMAYSPAEMKRLQRGEFHGSVSMLPIHKSKAGRTLDGVEHTAFPIPRK